VKKRSRKKSRRSRREKGSQRSARSKFAYAFMKKEKKVGTWTYSGRVKKKERTDSSWQRRGVKSVELVGGAVCRPPVCRGVGEFLTRRSSKKHSEEKGRARKGELVNQKEKRRGVKRGKKGSGRRCARKGDTSHTSVQKGSR